MEPSRGRLPLSIALPPDGTIRDVDAKQIEIGFARPGDAQTLALMSRDLIETGLGWTYRALRMSGTDPRSR